MDSTIWKHESLISFTVFMQKTPGYIQVFTQVSEEERTVTDA